MKSRIQDNPLGYAPTVMRKDSGAHYTPLILADFVSEKIISSIDLPQENILKILDPAIGDGELILSLLRKLVHDYRTSKIEIFGFDTDQKALEFAFDRIKNEFHDVSIHLINRDFLEYAISIGRNDLFSPQDDKFDIVIANPPYIRTQVLGSKNAQRCSR